MGWELLLLDRRYISWPKTEGHSFALMRSNYNAMYVYFISCVNEIKLNINKTLFLWVQFIICQTTLLEVVGSFR